MVQNGAHFGYVDFYNFHFMNVFAYGAVPRYSHFIKLKARQFFAVCCVRFLYFYDLLLIRNLREYSETNIEGRA